MRRVFMVLAAATLTAACRPAAPQRPPTDPLPGTAARAVELADAFPEDPARQRRAGTALVDVALEGRLELAPRAEAYLERALTLDAHDLTASRKLARLLNLRLQEGDFSKAARQAELYDRLRHEAPDPYDRFVFDCFYQVATAARHRAGGNRVAAIRKARLVERQLRQRWSENPHEVETAAMAGNYALAFAGLVPTGRQRRLNDAARYLGTQQRRWDEQSVTARGIGTAPGTRSVFAFWLGQTELARGDVPAARRALVRVQELGQDANATPPMRQLAALARKQSMRAEDLAGETALVPVWPQAGQACVACHSSTASLDVGGQVTGPAVAG